MRISMIIFGIAVSQVSQASGAKMPNWRGPSTGEKSFLSVFSDGKLENPSLTDEETQGAKSSTYLVSSPEQDAYLHKTKSDIKKIAKTASTEICGVQNRPLVSYESEIVNVENGSDVLTWDGQKLKFVSSEYKAENPYYIKRNFPHKKHRRLASLGLIGLGTSAAVGTAGAATVGAGVSAAINAASIPAMAIGGVTAVAGTFLLGGGIATAAIFGAYYCGLGIKALYDLYRSRNLGYFSGVEARKSYQSFFDRYKKTVTKADIDNEPLTFTSQVTSSKSEPLKAVRLKNLVCGMEFDSSNRKIQSTRKKGALSSPSLKNQPFEKTSVFSKKAS